ncbi:MAG: substrate-binding domain-containing protein [Flavobacteriia bacterium]|nr:substrate-binding domain-containing protein [Flavobacteriia bacterium]
MKLILLSVLSAFFLICCTKKNRETPALTFKGSNTSNEVVYALSKHFNKNSKKKIIVLGGGSEEAVQEFLNGNLYYLNCSRKLSDNEIKKAERTFDKKVKEIIIGLDAIALIVNPKLGVHDLNLTQISDILEGRTTNWKTFGGPDLKIQLYGRKSTSGTNHFIKDKFAPNGYVSGIIEKDNAKEIVKAIKQDLAGFSYVDLASISTKEHFPIEGIWAINIAIEGGSSISPFERMAVLNGNYPLSRPLYQYIVDFEDIIINDFINFELSDIGQDLMEREGFFKILPMHRALNKENGF